MYIPAIIDNDCKFFILTFIQKAPHVMKMIGPFDTELEASAWLMQARNETEEGDIRLKSCGIMIHQAEKPW